MLLIILIAVLTFCLYLLKKAKEEAEVHSYIADRTSRIEDSASSSKQGIKNGISLKEFKNSAKSVVFKKGISSINEILNMLSFVVYMVRLSVTFTAIVMFLMICVFIVVMIVVVAYYINILKA